MLEKLPSWIVGQTLPSFYETEGATAIEMVAKLYGHVNACIEEINTFTVKMNKTVADFKESTNKDEEIFRVEMRQHFQDFIDTINLKIMEFEVHIDDIVGEHLKGFKDEILVSVNAVTNKAVSDVETALETCLNSVDTKLTDHTNQLTYDLTLTVNNMLMEHKQIIDEAILYMHTNLESTASSILTNLIESGEVQVGMYYDSEDERLTLTTVQMETPDDGTSMTYYPDEEKIVIT